MDKLRTEIALLTAEKRVASVVACEVCDLYVLSRASFEEAVHDHQYMRKVMERVAKKRLREVATMSGR